MRRLLLTAVANTSIADIAARIAEAAQDRQPGEAFIVRLRDQCHRLANLPGALGRPRPELGDDLRSFPFRGYIIVFRYLPEAVEIVDILNDRQDIDARFAEDDD
jgi:toxin ParE1/3/4